MPASRTSPEPEGVEASSWNFDLHRVTLAFLTLTPGTLIFDLDPCDLDL